MTDTATTETRIVTVNNLAEVALWCGGHYSRSHPSVVVPLGDNQEIAWLGDAVTRDATGNLTIIRKGK